MLTITALSFTGCNIDPALLEAIVEAFSNPSVDPDEPAVEVPDDIFVCTYNAENYQEFLDALDSFKAVAIQGTELDKIVMSMGKVEHLADYCSGQQELANIVYFASMSDEDHEKLQEMNDYAASMSAALTAAYKEIYLSDSPYKELVFADATEAELEALVNADESAILLYSNGILEAQEQFYALDPADDTWTETVDKLYLSVIENGNALAAQHGYDNYYEYAEAEGYLRDYDIDKEAFRSYVAEYTVPLFKELLPEMLDMASGLSFGQMLTYYMLSADYDVSGDSDYLDGFVDSFDGSVKENAKTLFDGKHILWGEAESYPAACTLDLSYMNEAVCYFGPGPYSGISTIAHEMGHYISMAHYDTEEVSYDFLETHSQATEMLLLGYLENQLPEAVYKLVETEKLATFASNVIIATVVDDFEETVYKLDEPLTSEKIDSIIDGLEKKYGIEDIELLDMNSYIRQVVVSNPVYYISYATSALSSMGLYCIIQNEGYDAAYDCYERLQEGPLDATFIENLEYAELPIPFDEETFKLISDTIGLDAADAAA